jgi:hypothetical protein
MHFYDSEGMLAMDTQHLEIVEIYIQRNGPIEKLINWISGSATNLKTFDVKKRPLWNAEQDSWGLFPSLPAYRLHFGHGEKVASKGNSHIACNHCKLLPKVTRIFPAFWTIVVSC